MTAQADIISFLTDWIRRKISNERIRRFACYYDKLTENVDYGKIAARCHELIKRYSSEHEVVLDLACGTGSLSEALARLDYDVVGVDLSDQMLEEAMDKRYESGLNIQYLMQDMTELDLYGAVDAVVCVLDSINHLENEKLSERLLSVYQNLPAMVDFSYLM